MKAVLLITGLAATIGLSLLGVRLGDAMPQVAKGEGVLSVAFGDARETISRAMVHKADSYFHGGVDMECSLDHDHECDGAECPHKHHHAADDSESINVDCEHPDTHPGQHPNEVSWDTWRWINSRIRAPKLERHLEEEKIVELMPWFWAAVKADPHNIDAWTTAYYMAAHGMKDDRLAQEILKGAKLRNPEDLEILLTEGKFLYKRGRGDVPAAKAVFVLLRDKALARCNNNLEQLEDNDRWMYKFALNYLAEIEKLH